MDLAFRNVVQDGVLLFWFIFKVKIVCVGETCILKHPYLFFLHSFASLYRLHNLNVMTLQLNCEKGSFAANKLHKKILGGFIYSKRDK